MRFHKILCPTDFSACSERAVIHAARLAVEHEAELVIAHVFFMPPVAYGGEFVFPPTMIEDMMRGHQRGLDEAVATAKELGARKVTCELVNGPPWAEITSLLEHESFDLCVIGTHGRTGVSRLVIGSVAEKVVRHATCSVLTVHADGETHRFRHALVPSDFSARSAYALDVAKDVVARDGRVTLLHVIELPVPFGGAIPAEFALDLDRRASDALEKEAAREPTFQRPAVDTCARVGNPGSQILHALEADASIDLVVMGSEGRTGIKRALLGSVAEKVVRHADVPVLVVRQR